MLTQQRRREAFTILEMVAAVSILTILAALVVPTATRYLYHAKIQADADVLDSLGNAKRQFRTAIDLYPGKLSQFGSQITLGDSGICNGKPASNALFPTTGIGGFQSSDVGQWAGTTTPTAPGHAGPYLGFPIPVTGLRLNIGVAQNQMRRTTNNSTAGFMQIVIPEVRYADALALDAIVDGSDLPGPNRTDTAGTVRWATVPSGPRDTVTLTWNMGVQANCIG